MNLMMNGTGEGIGMIELNCEQFKTTRTFQDDIQKLENVVVCEPIQTQSKYLKPAQSFGKGMSES